MSHNLEVCAVKKNGRTLVFNLWQTPTKVTDEILKGQNTLASYIEWVRQYPDKEAAEMHIAQLLEWMKASEAKGCRTQWGRT